jgi:glycosyltransferase involved in cell wall biosynthesis
MASIDQVDQITAPRVIERPPEVRHTAFPGPVEIDGKHFAVGGRRFPVRGVTYGTFAARGDGALFPERGLMKRDLHAMAGAGFTVVRTYTQPPDDLLELAADAGLKVLAGVFWPDWRYLAGASRRQLRRVDREAADEVRRAARQLAGRDEVLAVAVGNEVPADVVRWVGTKRIERLVARLGDAIREEDGDRLVTYANYPSTEYLSADTVDFLTFNVFLERQSDFRKYLTRLHHLAGDRPLVLGEVGLDAGTTAAGETRQAAVLDWQIETALERGVAGTCVFSWTDEWAVGGSAVEGWHFGLTRTDRSPRPALGVASRWNTRTVRDLDVTWPSISVVVCAYNAEATIDECLGHAAALDYPGLEVVVVDDGSTDATAEIARRHPVRVLSVPHGGLAVARNQGLQAATGDLVVFLDSDAYPSPEWPYYLALGMDAPQVGGVGGPNVPPPQDPEGAHRVARAPGGPVHVLLSDDRAEHVPGCNMAFWRDVLLEAGGFDPIYTSAGDDVDLCWRVLDLGWSIGFHPAALVWHHRRPGLRAYLKQQLGYGRSEALVEVRHPDRFTVTGSARWRGRIYDSFPPVLRGQRVYRGPYGTAAYQSVYRGGGHALDLAHQVGVPAAAVLLAASVVLAPLRPQLAGLVATVAVLAVAALGAVDVVRTRPASGTGIGFRLGVAALHLVQPLVRSWGRIRNRESARRELEPVPHLAGPVSRLRGGVLLLPLDRPRAQFASDIVDALRRAGLRVVPASGWEDHDARVLGSALVRGDVVTSGHPEACVQVRVRRRLRLWPAGGALLVAALVLPLRAHLEAVLAALIAADLGRGVWRTGASVRRVVRRAAQA